MNGFKRYTDGIQTKTGWENRTIALNTFIHSGSYGDMIFGLPACIALGGGTYYLRNDQYGGIGRLLEAQPYLKIIKVSDIEWRQMKNDNIATHDLDKFRGANELHVARMHLKAFNLEFNFNQLYLFNIPPNKIAKIVIQDTGPQRFPGSTVDWKLLKKVENDCVFMGNDWDWELFQRDRPYLKIPRHKADDIYEFARVIAGADLFVGNMSIGQTIAEGLKIPYVVDIYVGRPQYPLSDHGHVGLCDAIFYWYLGIPMPEKLNK